MRWSAVGSALMDFFFGVKDLVHNCLSVTFLSISRSPSSSLRIYFVVNRFHAVPISVSKFVHYVIKYLKCRNTNALKLTLIYAPDN